MTSNNDPAHSGQGRADFTQLHESSSETQPSQEPSWYEVSPTTDTPMDTDKVFRKQTLFLVTIGTVAMLKWDALWLLLTGLG